MGLMTHNTMEQLMSSKENNQLYRHILDSIPLAMVTMDKEFKITSFNKHAEKLTGYTAKETMGRPCHEILNSSRCENDCPLQTVQHQREPSSGLEGGIVNRHGEHISIRIGAAAIYNDDNDCVGYLETIENISRQKRREREKNNFISMIAHDMKSPLVGISGLIRRLKKENGYVKNKNMHEYLEVMDKAEQRLESMVSEFLEYSHLESGHFTLELEETDLKMVLHQVVEMHRSRAEGKNIVLSLDSGSLTKIEADTNRLLRVFTNIVDNAIKYSPEHSEVKIWTRETRKEIVISFLARGRGIQAEEIPCIFDAFFRTESGDEVAGYGLGLAASRAIIRRHGGSIRVESIPGKGSLFTVRLPKKTKPDGVL